MCGCVVLKNIKEYRCKHLDVSFSLSTTSTICASRLVKIHASTRPPVPQYLLPPPPFPTGSNNTFMWKCRPFPICDVLAQNIWVLCNAGVSIVSTSYHGSCQIIPEWGWAKPMERAAKKTWQRIQPGLVRHRAKSVCSTCSSMASREEIADQEGSAACRGGLQDRKREERG